ncbi:hypothetical protein DTO166G4_4313 [Paecilomyces variotii]|nr:hypothetical protein DTO164E3_7274 [Paecilomyces variotii]KAJ9198165.1 hypothetical protein DTO032I3_5581 [Paecilomyces variotii]KAJ9214047.1 hypothetical protein DTO166G4_4313 [Paecilomyces variotii]KAJ9241978.1 hypothetical protein DTO166G5_1054 [Paecilomyces variotii]KAJ9258885.1 hypothetical protein DTO195F2_5123 [Paecilomyces variotii]
MKLIVAGATGFVGTEVVRQALSNPGITSVIALARRTTPVPQNTDPGADISKLKCVVTDNFEEYSEDARKDLSDADACIWLLAVTPSKSKTMPWEEVRKICYDYTVKGLETIAQLPRDISAGKPLRFIYTSGAMSERDQSNKPWLLGDYCLMRGATESFVLNYAKESKCAVEAAVAKPGLINAPGKMNMAVNVLSKIGRSMIGLPMVDVSEVAATLIDQSVNGLEKETLLNEDLVRIGQKALARQHET